ncbi:putative reverse transcriptase domain-containing protein [Tanacetum coccineum]
MTAFKTRYEQFKYRVMPFGLINTPEAFTDLMNRVYKPYLDKFMIVFIDDIAICSSRNKEYEEHIRLILRLLKNKELCTEFSKCEFWLPKVKYIGYVVDSQEIHVDTAKIKVRALVMTINSNLPPQIHKARVESLKTEKVKDENLHGMDKELRLVLIELHALGAGVGYHALES